MLVLRPSVRTSPDKTRDMEPGNSELRHAVRTKRATEDAWYAKSEGSDNAMSAYRPIFLSGRQTTQFANKKNISMLRLSRQLVCTTANNPLETQIAKGRNGC